MRWRTILLLVASLVAAAPMVRGQELIDRVVARVENDIILQSEVRALSHYQQFVDGKTESGEKILERLIDQWIVRNEAETARFPHPSDAEVTHGVERLQASFASPKEYESRKKEAALNVLDIRNMVATQLYLSNYLDSRFRSAVQIAPKEVEDFYQSAVVTRAKARNQAPPALDASREYIQEALVQRGINEQADRWLKESRARLRVEKLLTEDAK
jgi:parvulin-like peptidyl-prolyl isomerase